MVVASASAATVRGTPRDDLLRGTGRADRILARAGNDRIVAQLGGRDSISCGSGRDLVSADLRDAVARDCETVSRQIARDTTVAVGAQHETQVEPDSFAFGSSVVTVFQVGRFAGGGAAANGFSTSTNGGRTWRSGLLPGLTAATGGPFTRASDPVIAYDAAHGVWLAASLAFTPGRASAIVVNRSADGLAWSDPTIVTAALEDLAQDKEWIVCDNWRSSRFRGSCYVSYSDLDAVALATQTSRDGGLTWGPQVYSPDRAGREGIEGPLAPAPQPLVRPDGEVVITIVDGLELKVVRSTDGGATFSPAERVADVRTQLVEPLRAPTLHSAELDGGGTIYVAWADCRFRARCDADDVVFTRSADGRTWEQPRRVTIAGTTPGTDHLLPGLAVDPASSAGRARLGLVYYTRRDGRLDVGFVSSTNGGATWRRPIRLSPESMPLSWLADARGRFVGDYMSASFVDGSVVPIFVLAMPPAAARFREAVFATRMVVE